MQYVFIVSMKFRSLVGVAIGYAFYTICLLAFCYGIYVIGYVTLVTAPATGQEAERAVGQVMFSFGLTIFAFVGAKAAFHVVDHPNWVLDRSDVRDSISFR